MAHQGLADEEDQVGVVHGDQVAQRPHQRLVVLHPPCAPAEVTSATSSGRAVAAVSNADAETGRAQASTCEHGLPVMPIEIFQHLSLAAPVCDGQRQRSTARPSGRLAAAAHVQGHVDLTCCVDEHDVDAVPGGGLDRLRGHLQQ